LGKSLAKKIQVPNPQHVTPPQGLSAMKPGNKYLLILVLATTVGLGLLIFLGNSQPNVEVVVLNQSGQSLAAIHLKTEKSEKNIVLRGVAMGAQVTVKFHNDGADTFSLLVRFAAGKEITGDPVYFEPGFKGTVTITEKEIISAPDDSQVPAS
jgi:hypothetical protein